MTISEALDVHEFRGFALTDKFAPVVFINSKDAFTAQTFTLAHELTHIWIGQSGISNPDPTDIAGRDVEQFCNRVAAEVLVPNDEFRAVWEATVRHENWLSDLSREFWVSTLVILRKAFDLQKIGRDEFFSLVKQEKESPKAVRRSGGGGERYARIVARNSQKLLVAVRNAVHDNRLLYQDAARLLEVSGPTFANLLKKRIG